MNSVTIVGFVGADPEHRQARNDGSKFAVRSVAKQRSWKNAEDEWARKSSGIASRYFALGWLRLFSLTSGKALTSSSKAPLVCSTYERPNGKGKKKPGPRRSLRGRFSLPWYAGSIAANKSCRPLLKLRTPPPKTGRSNLRTCKALWRCWRAFFFGNVRNCGRKKKLHPLTHVSRYSSAGIRALSLRARTFGNRRFCPHLRRCGLSHAKSSKRHG